MAAPVRVEGWYRSHTASLRRRLAELWEARCSELERAQRTTIRLGARRMGRIVGGVAGVLGALGMFGVAAMLLVDDGLEPWLPICLVGGWVVFGLGRLIGGLVGSELFLWRLGRLLRSEGEIVRDVERLEELDVPKATTSLVDRLEVGSLAWPLAALSLLGPLSIHLLVWLVVAGPGRAFDVFGKWIAISAAVVGHAHLVLAFLSWRYVRRLRREPWGPSGAGWGSTLGWTVLTSAVPGVILIALPPILVAITGLLVIPTMFAWARSTLGRERLALAAIA